MSYELFREDTQGNIINSLGTGSSPVISAIRALLCIDLLFTAPMMLAVGRELIEHAIMSRTSPGMERHADAVRNTLRIALAALLLGVAYVVEIYAANAFYNVVSLVGGLCGFTLGFMYPPAMYVRMYVRMYVCM